MYVIGAGITQFPGPTMDEVEPKAVGKFSIVSPAAQLIDSCDVFGVAVSHYNPNKGNQWVDGGAQLWEVPVWNVLANNSVRLQFQQFYGDNGA